MVSIIKLYSIKIFANEICPLQRSKGTDEVFFVQNAGPPEAGTGLHKSSIVEKISLAEAAAVANKTDAVGLVTVENVTSSTMVINPNGEFKSAFMRELCFESDRLTLITGANNYRGKLIFTGEGQGPDKAPALYVMNPKKPYDTKGACFAMQSRFGGALNAFGLLKLFS